MCQLKIAKLAEKIGFEMVIDSEISGRMRRCRSWFDHADQIENQKGNSFYDVFLCRWIALAALYESDMEEPGKQKLKRFAEEMIAADRSGAISAAVRTKENLLAGYAIQTGKPRRRKARVKAFKKDLRKMPSDAMRRVLWKMYGQRNLMVHGHIGWDSAESRRSFKDASKILKMLIPVFLGIAETLDLSESDA